MKDYEGLKSTIHSINPMVDRFFLGHGGGACPDILATMLIKCWLMLRAAIFFSIDNVLYLYIETLKLCGFVLLKEQQSVGIIPAPQLPILLQMQCKLFCHLVCWTRIDADTRADTKRSVRSAFYDSNVSKNPANSMLVGWYGSPLTPVAGVQIPLGLPIKKTRG